VENQHRKIAGYRELNEVEIGAMNSIKEKAEEVGKLLEEINAIPGIDPRCVAIAKTEAQTAFMWAVRAIARPTTF